MHGCMFYPSIHGYPGIADDKHLIYWPANQSLSGDYLLFRSLGSPDSESALVDLLKMMFPWAHAHFPSLGISPMYLLTTVTHGHTVG